MSVNCDSAVPETRIALHLDGKCQCVTCRVSSGTIRTREYRQSYRSLSLILSSHDSFGASSPGFPSPDCENFQGVGPSSPNYRVRLQASFCDDVSVDDSESPTHHDYRISKINRAGKLPRRLDGLTHQL